MLDPAKIYDMDTTMLMSMINMKLRDEFGSLDSLVSYYDLDQDKLLAHLKAAGFDYFSGANQFR
ncbi:DUF4250 domain-containing protein [Agaribacterium haliotis]|uniref:DUF4250 domain-containing protein n=1 Tax=Agaribacterium haliotis TaxID=2013869 RepID=UPI0019564EF7|nr:DUF4250 domain-containing protein [Agaribacterium haliotis]